MAEEVNMATVQLMTKNKNFILDKKDFKTGSKGYHGVGKMVAGGKRLPSQHSMLLKLALNQKKKKSRKLDASQQVGVYPKFYLKQKEKENEFLKAKPLL